MRDAIVQADIMCSNFIKNMYGYNKLKNTTIVIVGDHKWAYSTGKFSDMVKKVKDREIYNVFINTKFDKNKVMLNRSFAPFDIAPTILESLGVVMPEHRFGLGTSLFSSQKTLLEKQGFKYVNDELRKPSKFYQKLF